jgi:outer membrane murein-binding lipoprotein Lpp
MKRVLLLGAVLAVALYATVAWSATPPTPTEKKLLTDVATLKAQVKTLKASVKQTREIAIGLGIIGACNTAITADGLQGTWQVIDQLSAATQAGKTYFGPQTPVDDTIGTVHICAQIGVTRSQGPPPTAAPFSALLALFQK